MISRKWLRSEFPADAGRPLLHHEDHKGSCERQARGPFAGTNFWAWGDYGRAQHADFRMLPGDTSFVGDPPQEPRGANSLFDSDAPTLEIVRDHAAALTAMRT